MGPISSITTLTDPDVKKKSFLVSCNVDKFEIMEYMGTCVKLPKLLKKNKKNNNDNDNNAQKWTGNLER